MKKQTCRNCKNNDKGICSVLKDNLLVMVKYDYLEERKPEYSIVLKDKILERFKCSEFESRGED